MQKSDYICFTTCRKGFGVSDGAHLLEIERAKSYDNLPADNSVQRISHLISKFENSNEDLYDSYKEMENFFDHEPIKKCLF